MKRKINMKSQMEGETHKEFECKHIAVFGARHTKQNKIRRNIMKLRLGKHFILAAVMVLSLLLVAPLYAATHTVTFAKEDLLFSEVDGYALALLKDGAYMTDVGKPQLPTKSLRVIIPPGSTVADITIDETSKMKLEGIFTIYPVQEFKAAFLPPHPFAEPDPEVYGQAAEYPGDLVHCVGESYIGGSYKVAHLVVFPLQYAPKSGELHLYESITFTLRLVKGGPDVPKIKMRTKTSQESWDLHIKETAINPEDAEAHRVPPEVIGDNSVEAKSSRARVAQAPVNNGMEPCDYIIITSDTVMANAFMPLAEWRIKKGIPTEIFTVSWIESNYTGADTQGKIKNFIYDCYTNRGTQHVLLGGNSDLVPVRYSYIYHYDSHHNGEAATDLYYANCTIGDEEWEVYEGPKSPTPHVTYNPPVGCSMDALIPRVNVGRLLVADEEQSGDVINKILTYERYVPTMDYQETFLYHAADEGGRIGYQTKVDSAIPDYLRPNTRTLISDGTDADGQSTPENIISFMTGGSDLGIPFNFVWSVSHANQWLLTTNTKSFNSYYIDQIINQPRFNGSFYAWGCTSAEIGSTDPTILPTKWVNLSNGGGLAWIGSSIVAGGDRGEWHARYYHEEMWEDSDDYHHHNLGRAFAEAKARMIESWPDNPFDPATSWCEYHAIIWNLVGDPLVPLFNRMPRTLNVAVSEQHMALGIASMLNITVGDDSNPADGALVCVMKLDEDVYLTDYTDANGVCRFQLPALSLAGSIDVTVTKYNYRPYELTLSVDADPNITNDEHTLLLLHFNNALSGENGETPTQATGVTFEEGILGNGAYFSPGNQVFYESTNNINSTEGTLEFWIKPRWNGNDGQSHFLLKYGLGGGMLFGKDSGNFWRSIINRWINEAGTGCYIREWKANQWHHTAYTWDHETVKLYIDGILRAEKPVTVTLPVVNESSFQLGADGNGAYLDAVIDELRISDIERSPAEIFKSFWNGIHKHITITSLEITPTIATRSVGSEVHLQSIATTADNNTYNVTAVSKWLSTDPNIASVDEDGILTGLKAGHATISAILDGIESNKATITIVGPWSGLTDIDVTFIDRIPHYAYDADKNKPEIGDIVTFIAHVKLYADASLNTHYIWYMDGLPIGNGDILLDPEKDNTVSIDWIWDNKRHEIMVVFDPENQVVEKSEENNILYDFTDALIVGMAVERGLVDVFSHFQKDLGLGSMSFEDWFQRQIKIWNTVLMEKAGEVKSDKLLDVQDRVRGVISYHEDGSLGGGNCPLIWKDIDMLWGKLVSDIEGYSENHWAWFYEGSLPHELSHARYLPDTYILDLPASFIEIIDDIGSLVTETNYMPAYSWDVAYNNKNQGMMTGDYAGRYSLFNAYLLNRIAGERSQGCNTNGCCAHDTNWFVEDFPEAMYLRILHMDGSPWVNAKLDIYQREGRYGNVKVDNIIDYTLYTDSNGRALLPGDVFTNSRQEFVLKITSPEGDLREYRFVERTDFHIAYWAGTEDSFDYIIKTAFDPVPFADKVENVWGHERGETFDLIFKGRNFKEGGYIRFTNSKVVCNSINYLSENEVRVNITIPENNVHGGIVFRLYNPDGKFVRIKDPYEGGIHIQLENTKPYARFNAYDIGDKISGAYYFNGLWSYDWGRLFKEVNGPFPLEGTGPIASYRWDFGDGSPHCDEPFTVHAYSAPGTYNVTLTMTDTDGESATITKSIVVNGQIYYKDADGDGYGNPNVVSFAHTQPEDYVLNDLDCNDKDPNSYPGATELCDGKDNDCDGGVPGDEADADGDGFTICEGDCDDTNSNIYPGAIEVCDTFDNDCDEEKDEEDAVGCIIYYRDTDADDYGVDDDTRCLCYLAGEYTATQGGDCDDNDHNSYPGAPEFCDGKDNDCDGEIDERPCTDRIVRIADTQGYPGQMGAVVPIGIEGAVGIAGADICFSYDPDVLVAQGVRATSLIKGFLIQTKIEQDIGKICLVIANSTGIEANSGTLVEIIFDVVEFAPVGTEVPLVFEELFLYDENAKLCGASSTNGEFRIVEEGYKGDLNKDQILSSADAIIILQIAVGRIIPDEYQLWAGDVNEDGLLPNSADAILVLKAAVKMPTIFNVRPKSGQSDDTVTIIGWNFGDTQDDSLVLFGDILAEPISWSDQEIITFVPLEVQSGVVDISIDTAQGPSNTCRFTVKQEQMARYKCYYPRFRVEESAKTISVPSEIVAAPCEQLTIPIEIDDAAGIAGMDFILGFDPAVLAPVEVECTPLTEGFLLMMRDTEEGGLMVSLASAEGISDGNGTLVNLVFEVSSKAQEPDSTGLIIQTGHLYDENAEVIEGIILIDGQFIVQGEGSCPSSEDTYIRFDPPIYYPPYYPWLVSPLFPQGDLWWGGFNPVSNYSLESYDYQYNAQNNGWMGRFGFMNNANLNYYYGSAQDAYQWPAYYWLQNYGSPELWVDPAMFYLYGHYTPWWELID